MNNPCVDKLRALREAMQAAGIDYYMIPTADFHNSEYVAEHFLTREYFCGFTGSNGTLLVSQQEALLWTDGRYFIQAEQELAGSGVQMMRMADPGVPTLREYLEQTMPDGAVLGFDGRCVPAKEGRALEKVLGRRQIRLQADRDLADDVWTDRPALPSHPITILDEEYAGEGTEDKLSRLRKVMRGKGASAYVDSKLDGIMWLLNLRGNDVECNPVALCHILVDQQNIYLFVQEEEITEDVRGYAQKRRIALLPYQDFAKFLSIYDGEGDILCDPDCVSYAVYQAALEGIRRHGGGRRIVEMKSPLDSFKAVKNAVELANLRSCYRNDSVALCRFIKWLTEAMREPQDASEEVLTESGAAAYLDHLRSELPDYVELSFPTISAYGPNAAMMHYEAVPGKSDAVLRPEGMLLVDSGGQYLTGTTDVTRTIALGPVTEEMKKHYTLSAVSNLQLLGAVFLYGCTGYSLDILAREPLWQIGLDYKCGTGHGIGYYLNVHEAPPTIRWRQVMGDSAAVLEPGMIVSDEPGVYLEGKYGIRIETILEVVERETNENGRFLAFEPLTFVPLDRNLLDPQYLTPQTRQLLNEYHMRVYMELSPLMSEEEKSWLREQTAPV